LILTVSFASQASAQPVTETLETGTVTSVTQMPAFNAGNEAVNLGTVDRLNVLSDFQNPVQTVIPQEFNLTVDGDLFILPGGLIYAVENGVVKQITIVDGKPVSGDTAVTVADLSTLSTFQAPAAPDASASVGGTISLGGSATITGGSVISIASIETLSRGPADTPAPAPDSALASGAVVSVSVSTDDAKTDDLLLLEKIRRDQLVQAEAEHNELERLIQAARRKGDAEEIERLTRLLRSA
jgi:hypothetical protein